MDVIALAPGIRMALKALGFQPDQIVELMTNINSNIGKVGAELQTLREQQAAILARLDALTLTTEKENGRPDDTAEFDFGKSGAREIDGDAAAAARIET